LSPHTSNAYNPPVQRPNLHIHTHTHTHTQQKQGIPRRGGLEEYNGTIDKY